MTGTTVTGRSATDTALQGMHVLGALGAASGQGEVGTPSHSLAPADSPAVLGLNLLALAEHYGSFARISERSSVGSPGGHAPACVECAHANMLAVTARQQAVNCGRSFEGTNPRGTYVPRSMPPRVALFQSIAPSLLSLGAFVWGRNVRLKGVRRWKQLASDSLVYVRMSAPGRNQKQGRGVSGVQGWTPPDAAQRQPTPRGAAASPFSGSPAEVAMAEREAEGGVTPHRR